MDSRRGHGVARRRGGFTMVEMIVAMALVLIFGTVAVATLRYGSSLWRSGHRRSYAYDVATGIFHQIADDIGAARSQFWNKDADAFDTRVKFWVDYDANGRQRLRFVRGIPDDALNPRIRQAGDGVDNDGNGGADEEHYNLINDDPGNDSQIDEDLMPLEGTCEVAYVMGLGADDADVLYRAVLAPIGGTPGPDDPGHTFFDPDTFSTATRIRNKAQALAENVLHFEVRCWSQYTTTWRDDVPFRVWPASFKPVECRPTFTWDSDRLDTSSSPPFVMDWGQPGFPDADDDNDGDDNSVDEDFVRDNVFPSAIMVVVVVAPPANLRQLGAATLATGIGANDMSIRVSGDLPNYNPRWPYLRIDDEWIRFSSFDADTQTFTVAMRGARDTTQTGHAVGRPVELGQTFSRVFHNPTGKPHW